MLLVVDGDDELVGTQVYRAVNAYFQKHEPYLLWSNYMFQDRWTKELLVGVPQDYPYWVKRANYYRSFPHLYSKLTAIMSDLFLLESVETLTQADGVFLQTVYDNAMFWSGLEMSCKKVAYMPNVFYFYEWSTGNNDDRWDKLPSTI